MEELLPLANHPQEVVIEHQNLHRNLILHDGSKFLDGHLKSSITNHGDDLLFWSRKFRTQSGRQRKAHCPGTSGGNIRTLPLVLIISRSYHLMLTYISDNDCVAIRNR